MPLSPSLSPLRHVIRLPLCAALGTALSPAVAAEDLDTRRRTIDLDRMDVSVSTATRSERLLAEVPIRTEILRGQDMQMHAALDLSQAAELINGLRVESNCQNCNTSEVQVLGLPGAYNQILFDGLPLLSTLGSVYGLEQVPAAFIERIEVVKGGGSALYGPGAVAGVVNLVSARPRQSGGYLQAGLEVAKGEPRYNADARLDMVGNDDRFALSVMAQHAWNDGIDYDGDGYTEITRKDLRVGGMQLWFTPNADTRLHAEYQYTDEQRRGGNRLGQPEYLANITEALATRYQRGSLSWEQALSEVMDLRVSYAFADIDRDSFYGGLGEVVTDPQAPDYDPTQLDPSVAGSAAAASYRQYGHTQNPLHYLDAQLDWRLGAHTLAFGLQYKHERLVDDNRNAAGIRLQTLTDARYRNVGGFVQDEWALADDLDLVLGARLDRSSVLDRPVFSPRVAVAWQANAHLKWRAGISTGFRSPEIFVEDVHVDTLGAAQVRVRNVDGLKQEKAVTAMLGLDWRSNPAEPRWSWDASASFTRLHNAFVLGEIQSESDGSLYQLRRNAPGSTVAGLESNLAWQPSARWRLSAGTSWYRSHYDQAQTVYAEGGTRLTCRDYLKTPRWSGLAQITWQANETFQLFASTRYTGRMQVLNNRLGALKHTPDFWSTDIGGMWHAHLGTDGLRELSLSFDVKNLFDQRQKDLERGAGRDNDYVYGPRFARAWYLSARYSF